MDGEGGGIGEQQHIYHVRRKPVRFKKRK